jgi:hypothetical protein
MVCFLRVEDHHQALEACHPRGYKNMRELRRFIVSINTGLIENGDTYSRCQPFAHHNGRAAVQPYGRAQVEILVSACVFYGNTKGADCSAPFAVIFGS